MKNLTMARQLRIQPDQYTSRDQKPSQPAGQRSALAPLQERRLSGSSQCSRLRSDDYFRQVLESLPANRSLGREFSRKEFLKPFFNILEALVFVWCATNRMRILVNIDLHSNELPVSGPVSKRSDCTVRNFKHFHNC
jgi:hypothetical protein